MTPLLRDLQLLEATVTRADRLRLLTRIGEAQRARGQCRDAEETLRTAVVLAGELLDRAAEAQLLVELGSAVRDNGGSAAAVAIFERAIELAGRPPALSEVEAAAQQLRGLELSALGRVDEAVAALRRALQLRLQRGDRVGVARCERALQTLGAAAAPAQPATPGSLEQLTW